MIHNGYDDLEGIFQIMKSDEPLTLKTLETIGIRKAGHRVRLLALLDFENSENTQICTNKSSFSCCTAPNYTTGLILMPNLEEWLEKINLGYLYRYFKENGYDDLEHLIMLMHSEYPITDDVLKFEIGIDKLGHRHRILAKLREEANIKRHIRNRSGIHMESTTKLPACEFCIIM